MNDSCQTVSVAGGLHDLPSGDRLGVPPDQSATPRELPPRTCPAPRTVLGSCPLLSRLEYCSGAGDLPNAAFGGP